MAEFTFDANNNLNVTVVSGGGANASVGTTGSTAPTSATEVGIIVGGNLVGVSSDNPVPVAGTVASGSAVSGNPVLIAGNNAGVARSINIDGVGNITNVNQVSGDDGISNDVLASPITGGGQDVLLQIAPYVFNGTTWDRLSSDLTGALRVNITDQPVTLGSTTESTAAWTSATALNTAVTVNTAGYSSVLVVLNQTGTISGGNFAFEVSDTTAFTNAYTADIAVPTVPGRSLTVGTAGISGLAANNGVWLVNVAGWAAFRVRLQTAITGSGTANVGVTLSAGASGIIPHGMSVSSSQGQYTPISDNDKSTTQFADVAGNSNPLYVADAVYGGTFSGTGNASLQGWSKARTPTIFKTVQATATGNTAIWTPATGNKFRLLQYQIEGTGNLALTSSAVLTVSFQDASSALPISHDIFVPATAFTSGQAYNSGWIDLGAFGILSASANNALNVNLSFALTGAGGAGNIRVNVAGVEE